jgi:hypothetical protein
LALPQRLGGSRVGKFTKNHEKFTKIHHSVIANQRGWNIFGRPGGLA